MTTPTDPKLEQDEDSMREPCICPRCHAWHDLQDAETCEECGDLVCPNCIGSDELCDYCGERP